MSRMLASRSLCDGLSTAGFIAALAHMKLANIAAVLQIAPLIITVLSVALYREAVGWRRWSAIGVGFFGRCCDQTDPLRIQHLGGDRRGFGGRRRGARTVYPRQIGQPPNALVAFWARSPSRCAARYSS